MARQSLKSWIITTLMLGLLASAFCSSRGNAQIGLGWRDEGLGSLGAPPLPPSFQKPNCDQPALAVPQQKRTIANSVANIDESVAIQASQFIDDCLPEETSTDALMAAITAKTQNAPHFKKQDGTLATPQDWLNLAMLARSLVGEISTTRKCEVANGNSPFAMAVGKVVLNRMDFAATKKSEGLLNARDIYNSSVATQRGPMIGVLLAPKQFSAWNPGDPARKWAMCPAKVPGQKYLDKKGKMVASAGIGEFIAWQNAVRAATSIVFGNGSFREQTSQVKSVFYTKGEPMHARRLNGPYKKAHGVMVAGHVIDNIDCLELWDVMKPEEWAAKKSAGSKKPVAAKK